MRKNLQVGSLHSCSLSPGSGEASRGAGLYHGLRIVTPKKRASIYIWCIIYIWWVIRWLVYHSFSGIFFLSFWVVAPVCGAQNTPKSFDFLAELWIDHLCEQGVVIETAKFANRRCHKWGCMPTSKTIFLLCIQIGHVIWG